MEDIHSAIDDLYEATQQHLSYIKKNAADVGQPWWLLADMPLLVSVYRLKLDADMVTEIAQKG